MTSYPNLDQLNPEELSALAAKLIQRVETMDKQMTHHKSVNEKLAHKIALLKRFKFAKRSEQLSPDQASLLDDLIDTDIAAIEAELESLQPEPVEAKVCQQPKRTLLPPQFPRTLIHHEPDNSYCLCGCALNCGVQLRPLVDALGEAVLTHGVVHADGTPVQMLKPGAKKTHRAYV